MDFEKFEIRKVQLPLKNPFETGFGEIRNREVVILMCFDDERFYYGEASAQFAPLYNHEYTEAVIEFMERFAIPAIRNAESIEEYRESISGYKGNLMAKSAGEMLLHNRKMIEEEKNLSELFEGEEERAECGVSIGIQENPEQLVDKVRKYRKKGYSRAKIKIRSGNDVKYVKAVRDEFPDYDLMVDANSNYNLEDRERIQKFDEFNLQMIEQPLGHRDIVNHSILSQDLDTPICLDESIRSPEDVRRASKLDACSIINLKPQRVGGIQASKEINSICEEKDIDLWIGGLVESGIGAMYQLAAASMSQVAHPSDIAPQSRYFRETIMDKPEMKNGHIEIPSNPEFESKINHKKLEKFTEKKIEVRG
ncbi:MAG: o-succinylbenzoate synthase [Candidatus Nanohaloarchaea archaeon]